MLSCECNEWDGDGWGFYGPENFTKLNTSRRKRCISCKVLINIGATCLEFERFRYAIDDIEYKIHGDDEEIPLASYWMCEKCGEQYLNLSALGYCVEIGKNSNMFDTLAEYHKITGFNPGP